MSKIDVDPLLEKVEEGLLSIPATSRCGALLRRVKQVLADGVEIRIPVERLKPYSGQPRCYFNKEALEALSLAISSVGQSTPGLVRKLPGEDERYEIIDGERRYHAICMIDAAERPLYRARLLPVKADEEVVQFLIAGVQNFHRKGHTPLETAGVIERYLAMGFNQTQVGQLLGLTRVTVNRMHSLRNLVPEVRKLLDVRVTERPNRLPVCAAFTIARMRPQDQLSMAQRYLQREISRPELLGEVVKVSRGHGNDISVHKLPPRMKANAVASALRRVRVDLDKARERLSEQAVCSHLRSRPKDAAALLREVEESRKHLASIATALQNSLR